MINVPPLNVLLLDDHILVADGFKGLLMKLLPEKSEVDVFNNIERAKMNLRNKQYDFVLADFLMPGQYVPDFINYLRQNYPDIIILIVSSVVDVVTIKECLKLGANGYLSKAAHPNELELAFENTYEGRKFISSDLASKLADAMLSVENTQLTKKELEILRLLAGGHKTRLIAEMLYVSPTTIMTHKRNIMLKLNLHSVAELIKYAYTNHLV